MKFLIAAIGLVLVACSTSPKTSQQKDVMNPLLKPWSGPYGGLPPFNLVKVSDFGPALKEAMQSKRNEIKKIAENSEPANFDNTIAAMERTGETLERVKAIYHVWKGNMQTPEFQVIEKEMAPKFAALNDEIYQNSLLFQRIESVHKAKNSKLTDEERRLITLYHDKFIVEGARLKPDEKIKVSAINQKLASLETQFSQNVLGDEDNEAIVVDNKSDLDGLPQGEIDSAAEDANHHGLKGKYRLANTRSSMEPFLSYGNNRALREKAFKLWTARGDLNNQYNNNKVVTEILKLRFERSKLLGFPSFAHWSLASETMAKKPQAAMDLMLKVWGPAVKQVHADVAEMQKIVDAEGGKFKIAPWDYRYYSEKVRKAKFDLDWNLAKPYLQLEQIRKAMFWSAEKLYGIKFAPLKEAPVFHPDVTAYTVSDNDKVIGLWYFDPYARTGKKSGAWMSEYRTQQKMDSKTILPIVSNNSNFIAGKPGEPVLISWDDTNTMLHEFGHAIHGLLSNVQYPSVAGTNVFRDFVEFPSQVNERFILAPEMIKFMINEKGEGIPNDLVAKIKKAEKFNQGFAQVEYLSSAIVDMKLHLTAETVNPVEFEKTVLTEIKMPSEIVMRHRIPQFNHLFSGHDYSAGYYSYLWAQVLSEDAFQAFVETGDYFNPKIAAKLKKHIMSVGNSVDPDVTYKKFRGRGPKIDALLNRYGFPKN
jgi:peptidyl-dipeptidase Dcp